MHFIQIQMVNSQCTFFKCCCISHSVHVNIKLVSYTHSACSTAFASKDMELIIDAMESELPRVAIINLNEYYI